MGTITGGTIWDPIEGRSVSWKPAGPVVDEYAFYTKSGSDGYPCLGVVGNRAHWNIKNAGDHTSRSTHDTVVAGKRVWPKRGWVYAIDGRVPQPAKFEKWLVRQLKAGHYPHVKYFNINNRHHNRKFASWDTAVWSGDDHLHLSFIPGSEYSDSTILADYERYRQGLPPTTPVSAQPKPVSTTKRIIMAFPTLKKGAKGEHVKTLQAGLCARGYLNPKIDIDGDFGPRTDGALRKLQLNRKVKNSVGTFGGKRNGDGIAGDYTWAAVLGVSI